jgi:ankyrin repeat protein
MKKLTIFVGVPVLLLIALFAVFYHNAPNDLKSVVCTNNLIGLYKALRNGADPNQIISNGEEKTTPLVRVLENDLCPKFMPSLWARLLIYYGADVNLAPDKYTPLMMAVSLDDYRSVALLLSRGARKELKNAGGETASTIAHKLRRKHILELLEE